MKLNVVLGLDLSAYAEIEIEAPEDSSEEEIVRRVRAFTESADFEEAEFNEDWSSACALRIVSVRSDDDNYYILEDVALEPSPFDAGQMLQSWLRGYGPTFRSVINSAVEARLIDDPVMEVHRGTLNFPGAEPVSVEFECRKGATREEKDLAFLESLAQIGTIDYAAIGEIQHGS